MESKTVHEITVGGSTYRLPNAVAVMAITVLTGLCYLFIDDPQWASVAAGGIAVLGLAAKGLAINFQEITDLYAPGDSGAPAGAAGAPMPPGHSATLSALDGKQVQITPKGKIARWLTD